MKTMDTSDDIKNQTINIFHDNTQKKERQNKNKKCAICNVILIVFNILLIIGIGILIFILLKNKKDDDNNKDKKGLNDNNNDKNSNNKDKNNNSSDKNNNNKSEEISNDNSIISIYSVKSGQKVQLINPEKINLKDDDYSIETIENNNNLRNLKSISVEKGYYTPNESGYLSIKIHFKIMLNNLNEIFKNIQELIKVDLSNLKRENVLSMNSSFSGCSNLNEIKLEGIKTNNLLDMTYTFEKCNNLKNLNLSPIKTNNLRYIKGIFSECNNLEILNISSFLKVDENMFEGIKTIPSIISNKYASAKIIEIFYNIFHININISENQNKTERCNIGDKEKCKECNDIIPGNCLTCNKGYYLPFNEKNKTKCLPCNKIENCSSCFGDIHFITCSSCDASFYLENNKCIKKQQKEKCILGEKEKCKSCKEEEDYIEQCKTCNEGYYLSNNTNKKECISCNKIENCAECNEINNNLICNKCQEGYQLLDNLCIEKNCEIGKNEKCTSCKTEKGRKKECNTCNDGYFISEDNSTFCSKCSINNCRKCSFTNGKEICNECVDTFSSIKDEFGFIKTCECESGYNINNGICTKTGNWIKLLMDVDMDWKNGLTTILYNYRPKIQLNEIEVYINGTYTQVTIDDREISYKFNKGGIYVLEINIKKALTSMEWLFNSDHIYSVSFLPGFDCSKVTSMENMFVNSNIESIDMKYLNISNVKNLKNFISENHLVKRYEKLNEYIIDLSSFDTSQVTICSGMFHTLTEDVIIKISNTFTKCREEISIANKVINIDEIECQKIENCEKCNGSKETLKCSKCKNGYKLNIENLCIKQECNVGEKEKCLDCKTDKGKENECLSCNEGYYLPLNSIDQTSCKKCQIEGCKSCDNIDGICKECKEYYEPSMKDGKIIECNLICNIGEGNKCQTCNLENKNKCGSCNLGYKLMKDGICKKIENFFIASYNVTSINNPTYIMNLLGNNISFSNIEMYIDGKRVVPYIVYDSAYKKYHVNRFVSYKFSKLGINNIKIIINQTLTKMQYLFYLCKDLVNISFSETFDTSNVQCMQYLFGSCNSLESINPSSFNTSLVNDYSYMFYGCNKLTSLDLSNFEGKYTCGFNQMFESLKNLVYIDMSSLYSIYPECNSFNLPNVPQNGTIIANSKFKALNSYNWKIIYKD